MSNSPKILAKRLAALIDAGRISKVDLSRLSEIDRGSLDKYLKEETIPKLDALDKLAKALECDPRELIKPETEMIIIPHTIADCINAAKEALTKQPLHIVIGPQNAGQITLEHNPILERGFAALRRLANLDAEDLLEVVLFAESYVRNADAEKAMIRTKDSK